MKISVNQPTTTQGFTVVELLITLFVAAAFLLAGYQLFSVIITDGGDTRAESRAGNLAYDYLRRYGDSASNPCTATTPLTNSPITVDGLDDTTVTVTISCPSPDAPTLSKVEAGVTYGNPSKIVKYATYVDKSKGATPVVDVTDGLIARWAFNGNTNSDVGNANGSIAGGVTPTTNRDGVANSAYAFSGVDSYVNVPYQPSLNLGSSFTISAWINPNNLAARYGIFSTRLLNVAGAMQLEVGTGDGGGANRIGVSGSGTWVFDSVNNAVTPGVWQHVAYVMPNAGGSAGNMYVNGSSIAISASNPSYAISDNANARRIGQGTVNGQAFPGRIDDVRLYNRALSASEVVQIYNGGPR